MDVLLTALSAKNIHKTLAPWCLKAYADVHNPQSNVFIQEHTINEDLADIADEIYAAHPDVIGFSCYIWNIEQVLKLSHMIKQYLPNCVIILGGPEVSFTKEKEEYPYADYILQGAGEETFSALLSQLEKGEKTEQRIMHTVCNSSFALFPSPFTEAYFSSFATGKMASIQNQLVYYESSRGCPFSCGYCLSSVTKGVQFLPIDRVKKELALFVFHGAKCVKFVDRTFNADKKRAKEILRYIAGLETTCTFHFEVAADLFDEEMLQIIAKMPIERVQFEIGIQSIHEETLKHVQRKTDLELVYANIQQLLEKQNCHVHVDLIAGLPCDSLETFAQAINFCFALKPHMLQLGFLKLLKGSQLRTDSEKWDYVYNPYPPYQIFKSNAMSFETIILLKEIEKVVEKFYNSGMFIHSVTYAAETLFTSAYHFFFELALYCTGKNVKLSLKNAYTLLMEFLLAYGKEEDVKHYIKLDALTFDYKGILPDAIAEHREKAWETTYKRQSDKKVNKIRIEYFPFDEQTRLFIYDVKNPISKAFSVRILQQEEQKLLEK